MRLFAFLRPDHRLVEQVQALDARLAQLEAQELQRELTTRELHDTIKRMLARMDTHHQREKQKEQITESGPDDVTRALLRAKYPRNGG